MKSEDFRDLVKLVESIDKTKIETDIEETKPTIPSNKDPLAGLENVEEQNNMQDLLKKLL